MLDSTADLNQLLIFVRVVDARSFTAAGRTLGLPKSTISRKIAQLEERLGVQLLHRTTRKLALTEVGAAFYERCSRIALQVEEAERAIDRMDHAPRGLLRVAAPYELAPPCTAILDRLLLEHDKLHIELAFSNRSIDALEDGFDLVLRLDASTEPCASVTSITLGANPRRLLASPEYIERRGVPKLPIELERHDLLLLPDARSARLQLRGPQGELVEISARPRLLVNSGTALREAALAGIGIAMLPLVDCRADLASGRLRTVMPEWAHDEALVVAEYPTLMHLDAKLRLFVEALREQLDPDTREHRQLVARASDWRSEQRQRPALLAR